MLLAASAVATVAMQKEADRIQTVISLRHASQSRDYKIWIVSIYAHKDRDILREQG
jgi:hypothetical protein